MANDLEPLSNFTPHAQRVIQLARTEANRLNSNFVSTEHLLLGIIKLGRGTAVNVLRRLGLDLNKLRMEVEKQTGTGTNQHKAVGYIPFTPRVQKVLTLSYKAVEDLHHTYVGTEHILLGLLLDGDGVAARVLLNLNLNVEQTRREILNELDPVFTSSSRPAAPNKSANLSSSPTHVQISVEDTLNLTPRAQQVLRIAREETDRFNHNFVGTEHLLLGLIKLGQGVAVNVLQKLGLDLETVRLEIETDVGTGPDQKMIGNIPYTPRVKKVLAFAAKEAKNLNHAFVGTEHILLGLLLEGDGVAARVLLNLNLSVDQTRNEILKELDPSFEPASHPIAPQVTPEIPTTANPVHNTIVDTLNFTPRARQALWMAYEDAGRFRHNYVGTEHLLLGLIRLETGVAANVMLRHGLDVETVRLEIQKQVASGKDQKNPYTESLMKALARAAKWARNLNHTYVGTEHILLGLLEDDDGGAAVILRRPNISIDRIRQDILRDLDPNFGM